MNIEDFNKISDSVSNRESLIVFIRTLSEEMVKNPNAWENHDLPAYLMAMANWLEDMDARIPKDVNWVFLRDVLQASAIYE